MHLLEPMQRYRIVFVAMPEWQDSRITCKFI